MLVAYIDGLCDKRLATEVVAKQIAHVQDEWQSGKQAYDDLTGHLFPGSAVKDVDSFDDLVDGICGGKCAVVVDGVQRGLLCDIQGWRERAIDEPSTEVTVRGPKEGFVETLRTNTSMLRRRIAGPRLRIEEFKIGRITRTTVAMAYVHGLADEELVREVRSRLCRIDVDAVHESGHVEEYIEDAPLSLFPTMLRTERPDRVTGALLEGRAAILTDGTPFALIAPATFTMFLTAPEDYYERYFIGSALRILRLVAFLLSLALPSLYVAVTTFHQEMIPTPLALSIAAQREGIPFPAAVEAVLMEFIFEVLREAGVRLPRIVGPAVSIIGGLVIGDAAIRAGLASPAMVLVVALTGIASFTTPVFSLAIGVRLLRFVMIALAGSLGLFGIVAGMIALLTHLSALRSFGVPFLEPLAPVVFSELTDTLVRAPWWALDTRHGAPIKDRGDLDWLRSDA